MLEDSDSSPVPEYLAAVIVRGYRNNASGKRKICSERSRESSIAASPVGPRSSVPPFLLFVFHRSLANPRESFETTVPALFVFRCLTCALTTLSRNQPYILLRKRAQPGPVTFRSPPAMFIHRPGCYGARETNARGLSAAASPPRRPARLKSSIWELCCPG